METQTEFDQFAYTVSHDLQEQVRNISNFTGLMEKHALVKTDDDLRYYMNVVSTSAEKLNQMLGDLLAFSRIGKVKNKETLSISEVINGLLTDMDQEIVSRKPEIRIGPMPELNGNPAELKILFKNLLSNAVKFNTNATPEIYIECKNKSPFWQFSIRDNGIGISENHLTRIFTMFQRLNPGEDFPGNGAGLAICKKIISWHEGKIWAESEPGKGSVFYFTLPKTELPA